MSGGNIELDLSSPLMLTLDIGAILFSSLNLPGGIEYKKIAFEVAWDEEVDLSCEGLYIIKIRNIFQPQNQISSLMNVNIGKMEIQKVSIDVY